MSEKPNPYIDLPRSDLMVLCKGACASISDAVDTDFWGPPVYPEEVTRKLVKVDAMLDEVSLSLQRLRLLRDALAGSR
jgi:hypothetical protein